MDYYSVPRRILRGAKAVGVPTPLPFCDRVLGSVPICPDCAAELEELRRKPGMRLDASQHYLGELTGAAAPFRYEGCVRRGILHTKYHAAPWAAVELGLWLAKLAFGSRDAYGRCRTGAGACGRHVPWVRLHRSRTGIRAERAATMVPQLWAVPLARALGIPLYPESTGPHSCKAASGGPAL